MILIASLAALGAGLSSVAAGYLFGARRGRDARRELAADRDALRVEMDGRERSGRAAAAQREADSLREELRSLGSRLEAHDSERDHALREELRVLSRSVQEREREQQALRTSLDDRLTALAGRAAGPDEVKNEMRRLIAPLLARDEDARELRAVVERVVTERDRDARDLRAVVERAVGPIIDGARIGKQLARLELAGPNDLPPLLDAIALDGGFSAVVLADDAGLPLAASRSTQDPESTAGASSLVFTLAERAVREGHAPISALVVRHADGSDAVHRIFEVDGTPLMLTAVARGRTLSPDAVDPALGSIERALRRRGADEAA